MKRFFLEDWWIFPIFLAVPPLISELSDSVFISVDWSAKTLLLVLYALLFLLSFTVLLISWIILLRNKQWWKFIISLISSVVIGYAIHLFYQSVIGGK